MDRRKFIINSSLGGLVFATGKYPLHTLSSPELVKLTILHTNDVHSRIDPFPMDGSRNQGLGGASKRASLIEKIRKEEGHVLLLDSGDIFQGTPYFNFFGGELEFKLMSEMKYDATTIGNHDFDAGIDGLVKQLPHCNFPFLISNYKFSDTVMNGRTRSYKIFEYDDVKVGVFGLGIELDGLVPTELTGNTQYLDPIATANRTASLLKKEKKCDYVICLSHLGYKYGDSKVSDLHLAHFTEDVDLILGGHTHTFMRKPDIRRNMKGREVVINQAGWAGIMLGRVDITFERSTANKCMTCSNSYIQ